MASIHPWFAPGAAGADGEEDAPGAGHSSKPNSLQMREGKAMQKKWREWSGEWERRKDSTEAQAEDIWEGEEAETMREARDCDWERE